MISIAVDEKVIEKELQAKLHAALDERFEEILLFWDLEEMSKRTCLSKQFLEKHILQHPKMKIYERRRSAGSKRIWIYEPSIQALKEIIDSW